MDRNLKASYGLFFSQRVLLALVDTGLERQKAYEMVQRVAMDCWQNKVQFPEAVRRDETICERLSQEKLDEVFDFSYYLRQEEMILARVFAGQDA
jgi:adenylosuccinate lyase